MNYTLALTWMGLNHPNYRLSDQHDFAEDFCDLAHCVGGVVMETPAEFYERWEGKVE